MVSHQIVKGLLNSDNKPSSVSKSIIYNLPPEIIVVADEINMYGLMSFYSDKVSLYTDLINAGNNIILDFELNSKELNNLLNLLEREAEIGNINKTKIDISVKKILNKKGYDIV